MKTKLFTIALWLFTLTAFAQNDLKARIEFEEAETAFATGDFFKTISHLQEASKILNKENSKIQYLKILAEKEIAKTDTTYFSIVKKSIEKFENLSDYNTVSDEKKTEIYKMYKNLNSEKETLINEVKNNKNNELTFQNFTYSNWELNVSITELTEKHKESGFFKARPKKTKKSFDYYGYILFPLGKYGFNLTAVLLNEKDIVKGYMYINDDSMYKGTYSITTIKQIYQPFIDDLSNKFGFVPQVNENEKEVDYVWKKNGKSVVCKIGGFNVNSKDPQFNALQFIYVLIN